MMPKLEKKPAFEIQADQLIHRFRHLYHNEKPQKWLDDMNSIPKELYKEEEYIEIIKEADFTDENACRFVRFLQKVKDMGLTTFWSSRYVEEWIKHHEKLVRAAHLKHEAVPLSTMVIEMCMICLSYEENEIINRFYGYFTGCDALKQYLLAKSDDPKTLDSPTVSTFTKLSQLKSEPFYRGDWDDLRRSNIVLFNREPLRARLYIILSKMEDWEISMELNHNVPLQTVLTMIDSQKQTLEQPYLTASVAPVQYNVEKTLLTR